MDTDRKEKKRRSGLDITKSVFSDQHGHPPRDKV